MQMMFHFANTKEDAQNILDSLVLHLAAAAFGCHEENEPKNGTATKIVSNQFS